MEPTVVKIKRRGGEVVVGCDIYIGRQCNMGGWRLKRSVWANPFPVGTKHTLDESLFLYEKHVRETPDLIARLPELSGKVLGCWCKPERCHGDVLVLLHREFVPREEGDDE
jgi:hypothetical protein